MCYFSTDRERKEGTRWKMLAALSGHRMAYRKLKEKKIMYS